MNGNRDGRFVGIRGKDNNVLVEGHTATLGTIASDACAPSDGGANAADFVGNGGRKGAGTNLLHTNLVHTISGKFGHVQIQICIQDTYCTIPICT